MQVSKHGMCDLVKKATKPCEYRSLRSSIVSPDACSGLTYSGVPITPPARVSPAHAFAANAGVVARDTEIHQLCTTGRSLDHDVVGLAPSTANSTGSTFRATGRSKYIALRTRIRALSRY